MTRLENYVSVDPVYERGWKVSEDEVPQLYDIYVGGRWIGSRRTIEQCERMLCTVQPSPT